MEFAEDADAVLADSSKLFVEEVSRGKLKVPHVSTNSMVRASLCFAKEVRFQVCCRKNMVKMMGLINNFFKFGTFSDSFYRRLSNVILKGMHKLEKDTRSAKHESAVKRARLA